MSLMTSISAPQQQLALLATPMEPNNLECISQAIEHIVNKNGFTVLQRYPVDLTVTLNLIQKVKDCHTHCKVALIIGDSHIHAIAMGIHPEDDELVLHLLHLSSTDLYYVLELNSDSFELRNIGRAAMQQLPSTSPYVTKGRENLYFTLFKHQQSLVDVRIESVGDYQERKFVCRLKALHTLSIIDKYAAENYANKAIAKHIGSLFFSFSVEWSEL